MEKMEGTTLNIELNNIDKMKELFPEIIVDGKINFDKLKLVLGSEIDSSDERYQFTWNGKNEALKLSQTMSTGSLLPSAEDSKNWDTTQNLYIEGDNLEVLKILQKSYYNKIKMIYIDPPYNTGNDFIYEDDFVDNIKNYKEQTNQSNRANPEMNGRYHTNWLNMMYPRLRLARNLLSDDGVIFISIDDKEQSNLRKICEEVFSYDNYEHFIWKKKNGAGNTEKIIGCLTEHILCFFKKKKPGDLNYRAIERKYKYSDEIGNYNLEGIEKTNLGDYYRPTMIFPIIDENTGTQFFPGNDMRWTIGADSIEKLKQENRLFFDYPKNKVYIKKYEYNYEESENVFYNYLDNCGTLTTAKEEINILFGNKELFSTPKPTKLMERLLEIGSKPDSLILDFFSGSSATAHAVMQLNAEDNGNRKFIMVQLPELTDESSEAFKANYKNICEIGKERIRRAGEKIKAELEEKNKQQSLLDCEPIDPNKLDIGFKVFKLDSSNIKTWDSDINSTEQLSEQLNLFKDPIKEDRTKEDVLYEIILKQGLSLTSPIEEINVKNEKLYSIGKGYMIICLSDKVDLDIVEEIGKLKPQIVIFKDSGFESENIKLNADQILKRYGVDKENIKAI